MKWRALIVLSAAQFLMVLDQAVMNVSISQLVEDFDTTVTVIQGVITFYALTMAALMITGGKLGDRWGRRRAFSIGLLIYAGGSALTAASWNIPSLLVGWSILEGIGAALVLPALVALIAGSYKGSDRAIAYGVIGGVAGAGIAVGPILGGWVTTNYTWRYVFVGEVILAVLIVLTVGWIADSARLKRIPEIDWVGSGLSALGLGLFVYGILKASEWGWIANSNSPITPFGLSLTPFVVAGGADIKGFKRTFDSGGEERTASTLMEAILTLESLPKPTIAAVHGYALGGGCELSLGCDFRYMADDAKIGQPEILLGIIPGAGGTQRLQRVIGFQRAKELIYTGRQVGAEEGLAIGYADKVDSGDELLDLALSDAADWATGPTVALAAAKQALADGRGLSLEDALAVEQAAFRISFATDDAAEGVNAFIEKREAHFKGS